MSAPAKAVGVVGLGRVGQALLSLLRSAGTEVIAVDTDPAALERARRLLDADGTGGAGVAFATGTAGLAAAGLVIEAVPEDPELKTAVLRELVAVCPVDTVLVTTADTLPLPVLAAASGRPAATVALRCSAPPADGRRLELVRTPMTAPAAAAAAEALVARLGGAPAVVGDRAARAARRLVRAYLDRARALCAEGYATREDIDTAMRLGCGLPTGPLELLDQLAPAPTAAAAPPAATLRRTAVPAARRVHRVGVVGSGTMARGIAEVAAVAGFPTALVARSQDKADAALAGIGASLARGVRRGKITPGERDAALGRLYVTDAMSALSDCDLVVEAVAEDLQVKLALFAELDIVCKPGTLLATTTSSLSVTACAEAAGRPGDVLGLHFFNPAPVMRLVEVVRTGTTSEEALSAAHAFCAELGKTTVDCSDRTGFIVNYLLFPFLNAAVGMVEDGDVDIEELDTAVARGFGHPLGPFALLDAVGLDVSVAIQQSLHRAFDEDGLAPAALLERLAAAGHLGRKSGAGFHQY